MILNFKRLYIHNFLSFGEADISLNNRGYVMVSGRNMSATDGALSNGSGKSAWSDAIAWCLTGETIRGTKNVVNMNSSGGTLVELWLTVDNTEYRILRTKDHDEYKTTLKVFIDNVDKSGKGIRDTEKLLQEYLPDLTSQLIGSVIILGQGLPQRFTNNTPAGRKEVLETLSKSDFMIADLKDRVAIRKEKLSRGLREAQDMCLSCKSKRESAESDIEESTDKLNSLESVDELETLLHSLLDEKDTLVLKKSEARNQIEDYNKELQDYRDKYSKLVEQESSMIFAIKDKYVGRKLEVSREKDSISSQILALKTEIKSLESIKDVCPTCGQKIPNVVKPDTTQQKSWLSRPNF